MLGDALVISRFDVAGTQSIQMLDPLRLSRVDPPRWGLGHGELQARLRSLSDVNAAAQSANDAGFAITREDVTQN